ncbi:MAG: ribosome biogenesis GTPase Der [Desulfobacteraceae bacterium]|nr:ribosome biogenesis GTPase Der [Desulfobacteraceae bacterium]
MTHATIPVIALVGRPNVGKSTLFNRLSKSSKALVDATPGVTRDRHYERVVWEESAFLLVDTGGIETGRLDDTITGLIQEQTRQAIEEASVIVFMMDGREGLTAEDHRVVDLLRRAGKPLHYLVNKIDTPQMEAQLLPAFYELGVAPLWAVSASHGYGLADFMAALTAGLPRPENGEEVPPDTIAIAMIGRPNVGKSSLANRLLGEERMMVSDIPGTTREAVDALLEREGRRYLLIDTAGIRRKGRVTEKLEKFSVMRALKALERCDIALVLIDAEEGITDQDTKVIGYAMEQGRACLILVNKWDLIRQDTKRQKQIMDDVERLTGFVGFAPVVPVSALTGYGVKRLFPLVEKLYDQYSREFATGRLNRVLQAAVQAHPPAVHQGRRIKLYYITQVATKPPTFVIFANDPKGVHFSYQRFLLNRFRTDLGLEMSPVRLILKERQRR